MFFAGKGENNRSNFPDTLAIYFPRKAWRIMRAVSGEAILEPAGHGRLTADGETFPVPFRGAHPAPAGGAEGGRFGPRGADLPRLQRGPAAGGGAAAGGADAAAGGDRRPVPDRGAHPGGGGRV